MEIQAIGLKDNPNIEKFFPLYEVSSESGLEREFTARKTNFTGLSDGIVVMKVGDRISLHAWCRYDDDDYLHNVIKAYLNDEPTRMETIVMGEITEALARTIAARIKMYPDKTPRELVVSSEVKHIYFAMLEALTLRENREQYRKYFYRDNVFQRVFDEAMIRAGMGNASRLDIRDYLCHYSA